MVETKKTQNGDNLETILGIGKLVFDPLLESESSAILYENRVKGSRRTASTLIPIIALGGHELGYVQIVTILYDLGEPLSPPQKEPKMTTMEEIKKELAENTFVQFVHPGSQLKSQLLILEAQNADLEKRLEEMTKSKSRYRELWRETLHQNEQLEKQIAEMENIQLNGKVTTLKHNYKSRRSQSGDGTEQVRESAKKNSKEDISDKKQTMLQLCLQERQKIFDRGDTISMRKIAAAVNEAAKNCGIEYTIGKDAVRLYLNENDRDHWDEYAEDLKEKLTSWRERTAKKAA